MSKALRSPAQQLADAYKDVKRRNKYRAKRSQAEDGRWFASMKERDRYEVLLDRERKSEISHLECQPRFQLWGRNGPLLSEKGNPLFYIADFAYFDGSKRVVEDVKSPATRTHLYRLKKSIVQENYPAVRIVEV